MFHLDTYCWQSVLCSNDRLAHLGNDLFRCSIGRPTVWQHNIFISESWSIIAARSCGICTVQSPSWQIRGRPIRIGCDRVRIRDIQSNAITENSRTTATIVSPSSARCLSGTNHAKWRSNVSKPRVIRRCVVQQTSSNGAGLSSLFVASRRIDWP